ncbi:hydroxypyruvate isomerase family protein [Mycolicibacterium sp.]|uniref:hydroxypyruvate isomerase family protein n=1 Tax=Mycolicibacterium sp. TaxID=2320850 RepID=UPI0037C52A59
MTAPLKFCANLKWLFTEVPFEARFTAAAEAGFAAVEYASPYPYPPAVLHGLLRDAGLTQILINTPTASPGSPGDAGTAGLPGAERVFRSDIHRALDYAGALDCRLVHVMSGTRPAGLSRDRVFGTLLDNLSWAAEQAAQGGVRLVIEAINHGDRPGYLLETQEEAAAVVEAIDTDHLGVLFDVYHCAVTQGDVVTRLQTLDPWIFHVQVADIPQRGEPGTGEMKWEPIFEQLRRSRHDRWIGCEYQPTVSTALGLDWLAKFGAR